MLIFDVKSPTPSRTNLRAQIERREKVDDRHPDEILQLCRTYIKAYIERSRAVIDKYPTPSHWPPCMCVERLGSETETMSPDLQLPTHNCDESGLPSGITLVCTLRLNLGLLGWQPMRSKKTNRNNVVLDCDI
jgi:hypothetical protein